MKQGTITKVLKHYFTSKQYASEIERALREFFDIQQTGPLKELVMSEQEDQLFQEWFLYDFKLQSGFTPLEYFYASNPYHLSSGDLAVYKDLQENDYGLFEVMDVAIDKGITVKNMQSKSVVMVVERKASHELKPGNIIVGRIGTVQDHKELIGATPLVWDIELLAGAREYFANTKDKLSPKEMRRFVSAMPPKDQNGYMESPFYEMEEWYVKHPAELEKQLQDALVSCGIDAFASVATIKQWLQNEQEITTPVAVSLLIGLVRDDVKKVAIDKLIHLVNCMHNLTPQRDKDGKTPFELRQEGITEKGDYVMDVVDHAAWARNMNQAQMYMNQSKYKEALREFDLCFENLLHNKTTTREIYRLYANKAVSSFAIGRAVEGKKLLELALDLNPYYDFAKMQFGRYNHGEYDDMIQAGFFQEMKRSLKDKTHPMNRWDMDEIREKWSTEEIMHQLANCGIAVEKEQFVKDARAFVSIDDFIKELMSPKYAGKPEDEDFVWIAAYALWNRWCSDVLCIEILSEDIEKLADVVFAGYGGKNQKPIAEHLERMRMYVEFNRVMQLIKKWKEHASEYLEDRELLKDCLLDMIGTSLEKEALEVASAFMEKTNAVQFHAVLLAAVACREKNPSKTTVAKLVSKYLYDFEPVYDVAQTLWRMDYKEHAAVYYEAALKIVEKRDKDHVYDLPGYEQAEYRTMYADYQTIFQAFRKLYKKTGNQIKLAEIKKHAALVRKRKQDLTYSPYQEALQERMAKNIERFEEERFEKDPANRYFQFLTQFHINFKTEALTISHVSFIGPEGNIKVGRNEPCFCGAKKADGLPIKFKHCHGK